MQLKPQKTDIDFLMRTIVFSLMILALLHAFKPYFSETSAAGRAEVEALAATAKTVKPADISSYIRNSQKPTFVLIYASWCNYCKRLMPNVYELWKEDKIPGDQMLLVSVDTSATSLSSYMLEQGLTDMTGTPLMLEKDTGRELIAQMQKFGSTYEGGIPYIGIFAPGGKLLDEIAGYMDKPVLAQAVAPLK